MNGANAVQGQEFAEAYLLEYRRVDTGPWTRFRDRNNSEVSTAPTSVSFETRLRYSFTLLITINSYPRFYKIQSPSLSPITHGSSSSSPSSLSPLAYSLTRSVFHSELKTWLFGKFFPPKTFSFPTGLIVQTLEPFMVFILLNGWICLHGVLG